MSKKSNSKLLVLGAGALAAYYLWKKDKSSTTTSNAVDTGTETATDANLNNFVPVDTAAATSFTSQDISSDKKKVTSAENKTATDTAEEKDLRNSAYYFGDKNKPYDSFYDFSKDINVTTNFSNSAGSGLKDIDFVRVRISKLRFFVCDKYYYTASGAMNKKSWANGVSPYIELEFVSPCNHEVKLNEIILQELKINDKKFDTNGFAAHFNKTFDYKEGYKISDLWLTKSESTQVEDNTYKSTNQFLRGTTYGYTFPFSIPAKGTVKFVYMAGPIQGYNLFNNTNPKDTKSIKNFYPDGFYLTAENLQATIPFLQNNIQNIYLKLNIASEMETNFLPHYRTITANNVIGHAVNSVNDNFNITEYLPESDFTPIMNIGAVYASMASELDTSGKPTRDKIEALMNN